MVMFSDASRNEKLTKKKGVQQCMVGGVPATEDADGKNHWANALGVFRHEPWQGGPLPCTRHTLRACDKGGEDRPQNDVLNKKVARLPFPRLLSKPKTLSPLSATNKSACIAFR